MIFHFYWNSSPSILQMSKFLNHSMGFPSSMVKRVIYSFKRNGCWSLDLIVPMNDETIINTKPVVSHFIRLFISTTHKKNGKKRGEKMSQRAGAIVAICTKISFRVCFSIPHYLFFVLIVELSIIATPPIKLIRKKPVKKQLFSFDCSGVFLSATNHKKLLHQIWIDFRFVMHCMKLPSI